MKQTHLYNRVEKYSLQCFGADIYKKLQDLEIKVHEADFWTPKRKYIQIKNMVKEYEQVQSEIANKKEKERYKLCCETVGWLRKKKESQIVQQTSRKNKIYIMDLMFAHAEYLKKTTKKKWIPLKHVYYLIKKSFYEQNDR